ncbi:hypothetical protein FACS1894102_3130 [Spirochaetia bacterium]|nr:hypothetical protein FACS1894102_3130 [Spirochaetia bacterium]
MKKSVLLVALFLSLHIGALYAQDTFSLCIGVEGDTYSANGLIGAGPVFGLDYRFNEMFSLGLRAIWAIDLGAPALFDLTTTQLDITVRWYFLRWKSMVDYYFSWQHKWHWFLQAEFGKVIMEWSANPGIAGTGFSISGTFGCRIKPEEYFFVEPYIRYGNPSGVGAGVLVGYTFHSTRGGY